MSDNDIPVIGLKETIDLLQSGQVVSLGDLHNVEAAMSMIKEAKNKVSDYKEIKKKRNQVIDDAIENLESRIKFLESVVIATLNDNKKKNVNFPGLGKATKRETKGIWTIKDEAALITVLKNESEYNNIVKVTENVQKSELNKLLDVWESVNKLPDCVCREKGKESVTISFEKEDVNPTVEDAAADLTLKKFDFTK